MGPLRNIKYERAIKQSTAPVAGVLIEHNEATLIADVRGLVPLPMAVVTSVGVLRFYRRPIAGELIDATKRLNPDDY